jgi:hypothetical protein
MSKSEIVGIVEHGDAEHEALIAKRDMASKQLEDKIKAHGISKKDLEWNPAPNGHYDDFRGFLVGFSWKVPGDMPAHLVINTDNFEAGISFYSLSDTSEEFKKRLTEKINELRIDTSIPESRKNDANIRDLSILFENDYHLQNEKAFFQLGPGHFSIGLYERRSATSNKFIDLMLVIDAYIHQDELLKRINISTTGEKKFSIKEVYDWITRHRIEVDASTMRNRLAHYLVNIGRGVSPNSIDKNEMMEPLFVNRYNILTKVKSEIDKYVYFDHCYSSEQLTNSFHSDINHSFHTPYYAISQGLGSEYWIISNVEGKEVSPLQTKTGVIDLLPMETPLRKTIYKCSTTAKKDSLVTWGSHGPNYCADQSLHEKMSLKRGSETIYQQVMSKFSIDPNFNSVQFYLKPLKIYTNTPLLLMKEKSHENKYLTAERWMNYPYSKEKDTVQLYIMPYYHPFVAQIMLGYFKYRRQLEDISLVNQVIHLEDKHKQFEYIILTKQGVDKILKVIEQDKEEGGPKKIEYLKSLA